MNIISF